MAYVKIGLYVIDHGEFDSDVEDGGPGSGHIDYCVIITKHYCTLNP